jgi:hypothetical protein
LIKNVKNLVKKRGWNKDYSRNLIINSINIVGPIQYNDHTGSHFEYIWHAKIENRRPDVAAVNTVCILDTIEDSNGKKVRCYDRSYLKWANQKGYQRTILQKDFWKVDIFAIHANQPGIYLHSAMDMIPRKPIITKAGVYRLYYKVFSDDFPLLEFTVEVDYQPSPPAQTKWLNSTKTKLII